MNQGVLTLLLLLFITALLFSLTADNKRIAFGVLLIVTGGLIYYSGMKTEPKKPEYDFLEVMFIIPMLIKSMVYSAEGLVTEWLGVSFGITGAGMVIVGCLEEHKLRKQSKEAAKDPAPVIDKEAIYQIMHSEQTPDDDDSTDAE